MRFQKKNHRRRDRTGGGSYQATSLRMAVYGGRIARSLITAVQLRIRPDQAGCPDWHRQP